MTDESFGSRHYINKAATRKKNFLFTWTFKTHLKVYIAETHDLEHVSVECQVGKDPTEAIAMKPQKGAKR